MVGHLLVPQRNREGEGIKLKNTKLDDLAIAEMWVIKLNWSSASTSRFLDFLVGISVVESCDVVVDWWVFCFNRAEIKVMFLQQMFVFVTIALQLMNKTFVLTITTSLFKKWSDDNWWNGMFCFCKMFQDCRKITFFRSSQLRHLFYFYLLESYCALCSFKFKIAEMRIVINDKKIAEKKC